MPVRIYLLWMGPEDVVWTKLVENRLELSLKIRINPPVAYLGRTGWGVARWWALRHCHRAQQRHQECRGAATLLQVWSHGPRGEDQFRESVSTRVPVSPSGADPTIFLGSGSPTLQFWETLKIDFVVTKYRLFSIFFTNPGGGGPCCGFGSGIICRIRSRNY